VTSPTTKPASSPANSLESENESCFYAHIDRPQMARGIGEAVGGFARQPLVHVGPFRISPPRRTEVEVAQLVLDNSRSTGRYRSLLENVDADGAFALAGRPFAPAAEQLVRATGPGRSHIGRGL